MLEFSRVPDFLRKKEAATISTQTSGAGLRWLSRKMAFELLSIYDFAAFAISAWLAYYLYIALVLKSPVDVFGYLRGVLLSAALFYMIARQMGQYDIDRYTNFYSHVSSALYIAGMSILSAFVIFFFVKEQTQFSRIWVLLWVGLLPVFLAAGRAIVVHFIQVFISKGALKRSVALVGSGVQFQSAKAALQKDTHRLRVVSALDLQAPGEAFASAEIGGADELQSFIREAQDKHVDEVIVALPAAMGTALEKIVQQVQILPIDVRILPDFGGANIPIKHVHNVSSLPLITTVTKPISEWGALLKIVEDYVIGVICLILFSPVMVLIALAIKADSDGPVLFRQRRHGYDHKVIEVLKFRTMTVLEDGETVRQATKNDRRVTRAGAFLRRTSLDELPQFLNVIRGEMSVVGPRPHALAHNNYYGNLIESYANRHRVKPGITGWAQVHGFRGETTDPGMMAERVRYDLEYIENWSIWLDLKIVIMTPLFGIFRRGAY